MKHRITFIPGDGVGPELSDAAKRCIEAAAAAAGVEIEWDVFDAGIDVIEKYGTPLPEHVLASIKKNKVAIKGPITTPIGTGIRSVNVELRRALELYACLRPCRLYKGVRTRYDKVDIVIVRENTEDLYAGVEFDPNTPDCKKVIENINSLSKKQIRLDSAISIKPISKFGTERVVRFAFEYALKNNRKKVTCVHKANIMKATDGLFLATAREVAERYAGKIAFEDRLVDNLCMQLVQRPEEYDMLVFPNLYGDIVSDLCAGLVGGLGVAPGANIGDDAAVFEATHGSAPKYKGMNKVNPTALILSGVLMLRHIGEDKAAERLENAVKRVISDGKYVTYDLKAERNDPTAVGTREMAEAIIKAL
ncbi:MAG: isocitrate dehydrogenase [Omnitrophica WOR_2 bacterium RIFCSPLOWO2_12_FULL_51_24]|nr:MAG: isocitrate dehydrogenase [Omnitrophica WOR_2 bacterium RIFCSPLOWO2_02_FULL_50_19]OGX43727.1 MAG: isocitrate dehydrogenase [Omnitrophica WOR_2 bacterium RIFCSPLOWO2_12_FULL_51_24]